MKLAWKTCWYAFGISSVLLLLGCSSEREPDEELAAALEQDRARLVERVLGERLPAAEVVARVGQISITLETLALYLELFPGLSVEQAIDDLADIATVEQSLDMQGPEVGDLIREGRARGAAHVWLRAVTSLALMDMDVEGETARHLDSPEFAGRGGLVPLTRVSHVLLEHSEDEQEAHSRFLPVLQELSGRLNETIDPVTHEALVQAVEAWRGDARLEGARLRVEGPFNVVPDNRMIIPGVSAVSVVPEFSAAAIAQSEGVLGPPVATRFGTHLILVHLHEEPVPAADERRRELAWRLAVAEAQDAELGERITRLRRGVRVTVDTEAVELLSVSPAERLRHEREELVQGGR